MRVGYPLLFLPPLLSSAGPHSEVTPLGNQGCRGNIGICPEISVGTPWHQPSYEYSLFASLIQAVPKTPPLKRVHASLPVELSMPGCPYGDLRTDANVASATLVAKWGHF